MSVDKFGRYEGSFARKPLQGPRGEGFRLTEDGDYDLQHKGLRNLAHPIQAEDAVTKQYVDSKTPTKEDTYWGYDGKRLSNILDPVEPDDAATKMYVDTHIPTQEDTLWKFAHKRLSEVQDPIALTDAATKQYVDSIAPSHQTDYWGFNNKRLSNVGDPLYDGEVVNLRTLRGTTVFKEMGSTFFDMRNVGLRNLPRAVKDGDAVNLQDVKRISHENITRSEQKIKDESAPLYQRMSDIEHKVSAAETKIKSQNIFVKSAIQRLARSLLNYNNRDMVPIESVVDDINWGYVFGEPVHFRVS